MQVGAESLRGCNSNIDLIAQKRRGDRVPGGDVDEDLHSRVLVVKTRYRLVEMLATRLEIICMEILPRRSSVILLSLLGTLRTKALRELHVSATNIPSSVSSKPRGPRRQSLTSKTSSSRLSARLSAGCLR